LWQGQNIETQNIRNNAWSYNTYVVMGSNLPTRIGHAKLTPINLGVGFFFMCPS